MSALAETAALWAGSAPTGHTVGAPRTKRTDGVLADPAPHSKALASRRALAQQAKREAARVAVRSDLTGADKGSEPAAPQLQTCECGQHVVEVGIANAIALRRHRAQLAKLAARR